jgi:DNA topoisomerase-1
MCPRLIWMISRLSASLSKKLKAPIKWVSHPDTGEPIYMRIGPYGPYVQLGDSTDDHPNPKRASLPKGVQPEMSPWKRAVGLLALPRLLGTHPETGATD